MSQQPTRIIEVAPHKSSSFNNSAAKASPNFRSVVNLSNLKSNSNENSVSPLAIESVSDVRDLAYPTHNLNVFISFFLL
jgi:hypothetical protein